MNKLLSFGLPTYNRALLVEEALNYYYNILKLDDYQLIISDNCSVDNTEKVVRRYMLSHPNLIYIKQPQNIGADRNMLFLQDYSVTDYFMLLGDGVRLYPDKLAAIISHVQTGEFDAIMFDYRGRCKVPSQIYTDKDKLLSEVGWYVTQMSSYIISKQIISNTTDSNIIYPGCEFNYYSRMFRFFANKDFKVYWMQDDCMTFSRIDKKNSWGPRLMTVWAREFVSTIMSLPSNYSIQSKLTCLREAGRYPLFRNISLINHIKQGTINRQNICEYKENVKLMFVRPWIWYYTLCCMPLWVLNGMSFTYRALSKVKRTLFK